MCNDQVCWESSIEPHVGQSRNKAVERDYYHHSTGEDPRSSGSFYLRAEVQLHGGRVPDIVKFDLQLTDTQSRWVKTADTLRHHWAALGMKDKVNLDKMKKDIYLTVHLNALAVKTRIRDHLHQCKFELERLKRSYRATINGALTVWPDWCMSHIFPGEHKLHANTHHSIKRREPGILKLVSTYNGLCSQLQSLIWQCQAPHYAVPPHIILRDGIFLLDVDDDIWQDVRLDDDTTMPPAWLDDDAVRNGIRLQLEVDRCMEEEARPMQERAVIQEWMLVEWRPYKVPRTVQVCVALQCYQ